MEKDEFQRLIGRFEAKLDRVLKDTEDHDDRISQLERAHWKMAGWLAAAALLATYVVPFLIDLAKKALAI